LGTLAITDCRRALEHLQPDHVHVVADGRIVATGGPELARRLETEGYESFT
jgi:Fe-S cluster assembly ATP-binding protein